MDFNDLLFGSLDMTERRSNFFDMRSLITLVGEIGITASNVMPVLLIERDFNENISFGFIVDWWH
jgi:hypothetical protein